LHSEPLPPTARAGYTLPVFACAAAIAALRHLHGNSSPEVSVNLVNPPENATIPIEQVARLGEHQALAIARSDPGDNLDLTRHTPIWAQVEIFQTTAESQEQILLEGGEGIGRQVNAGDRPAIYRYARQLMQENLTQWLQPEERIRVTIILPEGRSLAERTSNAAFGVVDGLSLLGTSGISQPLSAPGQLEAFREELRQKAAQHASLVFCIGENGLDLAVRQGISPSCLIKTANWLGPMLVEAALQGIEQILLFGYHGKLMKLAGGIFHTHHHVADGRREVFVAHCANAGMGTAELRRVFACETAEAALHILRELDRETGSTWLEQVYGAIAHTIDERSATYIHAHSDRRIRVGTVLFDRDRQIVVQSQNAAAIQPMVC
jgi:cobalt-precorrin-5B (C1)-methyltransferase